MKRLLFTLMVVLAAACANAAAPNSSGTYYHWGSKTNTAFSNDNYMKLREGEQQESITITFKTGSGDGTSINTSTACSTIVSEGDSYLTGNVAAASNAYYNGDFGMKLGKSSEAGSIKMNLASPMTPSSIVVRAKRYNSSKEATLKVNGSKTQSLTASFADYTFTIGNDINYIQLDASNYSWISSVTLLFTHHTATFSVNGNSTSASVLEGATITFPSDPASISGKAFCGWTTTPISGTQAIAPTLFSSATMGTNDVTYYAVFADESNASMTINKDTENIPTSYGNDKTFTEYTLEGVKFKIQQIYLNNKGIIQWRPAGDSKGTGIMYNTDALLKLQSIVLTYNSDDTRKNIALKVGDAANPSKGTSISPTSSGYVYTFDCSSANKSYFVLTNGENAGYVNSIEINYKERSNYCTTIPPTITLNTYGYATCCSQYPLAFTGAEAYSAWQVTGVSGSAIIFEQVTNAVAAGTGLLLMGEPGASITLTIAKSGSELSGNKLVGIKADTEVAADTYYGLKGNEFVKVNASTVPAGKSLLPATAIQQGVKSLTFMFYDTATGVSEIANGVSVNGTCYNLAGQRLSKPQHGINIVNGKKVLVK